jgi:hypothetical protein
MGPALERGSLGKKMALALTMHLGVKPEFGAFLNQHQLRFYPYPHVMLRGGFPKLSLFFFTPWFDLVMIN